LLQLQSTVPAAGILFSPLIWRLFTSLPAPCSAAAAQQPACTLLGGDLVQDVGEEDGSYHEDDGDHPAEQPVQTQGEVDEEESESGGGATSDAAFQLDEVLLL
jgi:hypothetical protein